MSFVALHCCSDVTNTTQSLGDQAQDTDFTNRRNILRSHLSHFQINIVRYGRSTGKANTALTSGHHTQDFTSKRPRFTFLVTGDRFGRSSQLRPLVNIPVVQNWFSGFWYLNVAPKLIKSLTLGIWPSVAKWQQFKLDVQHNFSLNWIVDFCWRSRGIGE